MEENTNVSPQTTSAASHMLDVLMFMVSVFAYQWFKYLSYVVVDARVTFIWKCDLLHL